MESMINLELRAEIELKSRKIESNLGYFAVRKEAVNKSLRSLGDIYSFWIENPDLRKSLLLERKQKKTLKKMARVGVHNIKNAWYYLYNNYEQKVFVDKFDENTLKRVNGLVEPKIDGTGDFRKRDVTLNIREYTPPSWEKVPEKTNDIIERVKDKYNEDPLESAIMCHLGIVAIQPFVEGNKRTARLIQNKILDSVSLPPAIISAGEGKFYFDLIKKVLPSYENENSKSQKQFYDYCASKVNNGLDKILGDLNI